MVDVKSIIAFAIEKEQEAIDFYTELAGRVKLEAVADELLRMADMEKSHREMLENLDVETFTNKPAEQVRDLRIADYTVDAVPNPEMSWPDIINIAMHRELASVKLYQDLAANVAEPAIKQLFNNLAVEEQKHKSYLETIWDEQVMKDN